MKKKLNAVNVVEFTELYDADSVVEVDDTVGKYIRNGSFSVAYIGNCGKYACSSAGAVRERQNIFCVDGVAISNISVIIGNFCKRMGKEFNGWYIKDCQNSMFSLEFVTLDEDSEPDMYYSVIFSPDLKHFSAPGFTGKEINFLKNSVHRVIKSLCRKTTPAIHLLEVCLTGKKLSEEGYNYCVSGAKAADAIEKMGEPNNTQNVMSGLSVICKENGFTEFEALNGKYAMLYAQ